MPKASGRRRLRPTAALVQIQGKRLRLSNLDKPLYPSGFTKAQVIDYYVSIADALLPHVADRPLALKRYPEGADAPFFWQKQAPPHRPAWLTVAPYWSRGGKREILRPVVDSLASLVWVANLASIELHSALSKVQAIDCPTVVVFDLDPGPPADIVTCAEVALELRDMLADLDLQCLAKTSGGKGLHVYVPLNTPADYEQTKNFARAAAGLLKRRNPKVTASMRKDLRAAKVFVDWGQNDLHKTTVCVYSLRAADEPVVSTPVSWDELQLAVQKNDSAILRFTAGQVVKRVKKLGDLFEGVLKLRQSLPTASRPARLRP